MKVLFAIKSLNVLGGGAERVLVDVANGLSKRGYCVSVLTFDHPGRSFFELLPSIERFNIACNEPGTPTKPLAFILSIPTIRRKIAKFSPDVVIGFMHSTYIPLTIALYGANYHFVTSEHTDARHYINRPVQQCLKQWAESNAKAVTVPSEAARQSFVGTKNYHRMQVVENPVNPQPYMAAIGTVVSAPKVIVSVGRFMHEKDHATLISAFAAVANDFPDWQLKLVGDGQLRPALEAQCRTLGIESRVEMPGYARDVASAYADARFVVMSSIYEALPLVPIEALASGRAVIGFDDLAGLQEVICDGVNGLLVKGGVNRQDRIQSLEEGLRLLMNDLDLCIRLGAAGPASIKRFDIEAILNRWERVIHSSVHSS